jgi:indolepyruvate ferredoxin oxidoreductase
LQLDQTGLAQKFGAVLSHVRIADTRDAMHGVRIPNGHVDLLLGADLMVSGGSEVLGMLSSERSSVVVNTHAEMPSQFILDRDFSFPSEAMLDALRKRSRKDRFATLDATRLASALLGDSIAANIFMLGFAFQRGLLPLSGEAIYRALELFGVNVEQNKQSFDWGRFTAVSPEEVEQLATGSDGHGTLAVELDEVISRRSAFLTEYQDEAYAQRYLDRIERLRGLEQRVAPGSEKLTDAAARSYFKLLAYKDEYEVARLYTQTGFLDGLRKNFRGQFKMTFHFSPPFMARDDAATGRPKKYEFGAWILPLLHLLARLRRLRGSRLDVFGYARDRRVERALITEYEGLLDRLEAGFGAEKLDLAVALASIPDSIRGFGPIKTAAIEQARLRTAHLLEEFESELPQQIDAKLRRSTAA